MTTVEMGLGPVAEAEFIAALDELRGFALLGIFEMNGPGQASAKSKH